MNFLQRLRQAGAEAVPSLIYGSDVTGCRLPAFVKHGNSRVEFAQNKHVDAWAGDQPWQTRRHFSDTQVAVCLGRALGLCTLGDKNVVACLGTVEGRPKTRGSWLTDPPLRLWRRCTEVS